MSPFSQSAFVASAVLNSPRRTAFLQHSTQQHAPRYVRKAAPFRRPCMSLPGPISPTLPDFNAVSTALLLSDVSEVNKGSLGATAFVFFLTFWGAISFVKGSTKPRITQASFTLRQPASDVAKKTARYLLERSFVADLEKDGREGVMTFTGEVRASSSVAAILVAVAASGLWALSYMLNFVLPEGLQSPYYGWLSLASFAIVPWYWKRAGRTEEVKVMVEEEEDVSTLFVKGHRDEIEEMERAFGWKRNEPVYEDEKKPEAVESK